MFPYDSLRDFAADLEAKGKLLKIKDIDQDKFELTALAYRLNERLREKAPGFLIEKTKINGTEFNTPVIGNIFNSYDTVAACFGVENLEGTQGEMSEAAVRKILSFQDKNFKWKTIEPVSVEKNDAPCKENILSGDDVDLSKFPWIKNNPADGGQYISAGSVIMNDPELGRNVGTYRMQVRGSNRVGVYFTNQSHGYKFMMKAMERGEESVPVSVAVGIDPVSFMMSSTRLADVGEDEFALAGGFRGKPLELVKSETNDLMVPAHAEFIIEGVISMETEEEGPYGEMLGYVGKKVWTFFIDIKTITHRNNPWVYNLWPGIGGAYLTLPWDVAHFSRLKKMLPSLVKLHTLPDTPSIVVACIDKRLPGEGIEAGMLILGYRMIGFSKKMVIVLDADIDPTDLPRVMHAVGTRWQPDPASLIVKQSFHIPLEPSSREMFLSSKIVIDATRQLDSEGGPEVYPVDNRTCVVERSPEAFEIVDKRWNEYFGK
ncbi:MAG: UbiD family decarboxylase [Deltaproteobacteria bacterium]|nr:UbiD family decarboxylase [Deltaproteobacteria bacterium]